MKVYQAVRAASYAHDQGEGETWSWVRSVLRLVRPILTFMLVAAAWEVSDTDELSTQIVYMASTAIGWWFGDRGTRKP